MKNKYGFTILEILTVIAIIIILIGIGIPAYNSWRNRAQIARARATIDKIEMALEMYKSDNGVYPQQSTNLNTAGALTGYLAQYIEFDSNELDTSSNVLDPWGNPYVVYVDDDGDPITGSQDFSHNRNACYIYSHGPDGPSGGSADNIDNYMP